MEIGKLLLYIGAVMFGFPFLLYAGLSVMMIKELMQEDDTLKTIIQAGFAMMILGMFVFIIGLFV